MSSGRRIARHRNRWSTSTANCSLPAARQRAAETCGNPARRTAAGTTLLRDIYPGSYSSFILSVTNMNGVAFFSASDGTGLELWKSDGTAAGTTLVKDIRSGTNTGSAPMNLTNVNGTLLFSAD